MHSERNHAHGDAAEGASRALSVGGWTSTTDELAARVDRFLALFNEASRRFADLFPYNRLKEAILGKIGDDGLEIVVSSPRSGRTHVRCVVHDGAIARSDPRTPTAATWELARETLDDALSRPSAYLCHPELFALGWFKAGSRSERVITGLRD